MSGVRGAAAADRHLTWLLCVQVESLYSRLCLDSEKMAQLMTLGFTEREARLGLRACQGDLQEAAFHISSRRQVTLRLCFVLDLMWVQISALAGFNFVTMCL